MGTTNEGQSDTGEIGVTNLSDNKPPLPTTLKIALGFVIGYGLLLIYDQVSVDASPYQMGRVIGKLVWIAVIVWALFRVKKYGWGVSVFLICGYVFRHVSQIREAMQSVTDTELLDTIIAGNVFFILVLVVVLVALLMPKSREPFKKLRTKPKP